MKEIRIHLSENDVVGYAVELVAAQVYRCDISWPSPVPANFSTYLDGLFVKVLKVLPEEDIQIP